MHIPGEPDSNTILSLVEPMSLRAKELIAEYPGYGKYYRHIASLDLEGIRIELRSVENSSEYAPSDRRNRRFIIYDVMETKGIDFSDLSNTDKVTDKSASKVVIKSVTRQFHNISVPFRLENMRSA